MDFSPTPQVESVRERIRAFMDEHVTPREAELLAALDQEVGPGVAYPAALVEIRERARAEGLWNLFMPDPYGEGDDLTNWEYGMLCEVMGRSAVAPMAFNCSAPDTGNMEILAEHGSDEQKDRWLRPLFEGEIRYEGCRVPAANLLGERGAGFKIAQDRLGPGRIHHCMRAIGGAELALEMMCRRANEREAFGGPLGEKQFIQDFVAKSRMEIDGARLMVLHAAWKMDTQGKRAARQEISMIKVVAANVHQQVLDRAVQVHGALGVSDDTPLALMWRQGRWLRLVDGADEVHKMSIAYRELGRWKPEDASANGGAPGQGTGSESTARASGAEAARA